jgi:hypothetical protein
MARKLPQSAPGTIFGFPVSKLRDPSLQRKVLFLAGVALIASIVVPIMTNPKLVFSFSEHVPKWDFLIWPIIAGGAYLLVAAAPPDIRKQVPPAVLQWIPAQSFWRPRNRHPVGQHARLCGPRVRTAGAHRESD